ncbi:CYTH and CHAD domain-containing protein [Luteococcus peritonei]|uniref:CYTH and CHAD domain-containing protein n=1 Tax=Luteococcus peritonei TaxID=88874 RepID=A0ABW4RYK1_9ACTN
MPTEIEQKFSLAEGRRITALGEGLALGERRSFQLVATYFDTPALTLARHKITLRRRTGGKDAGWHLKLPGDGRAREEVQVPLVAGQSRLLVPAELRERIAEVVGFEPLLPVVELRTRRSETDITTPRGRKLAELCDDRVRATRRGTSRSWRELEVELAGGDEADLARIAEALLAAGAEPKDSPSKLAEALGEEVREPEPLGAGASAADVVMAYVAEQVGMILGREAGARVDAPDAVHKMRVATRRLRSTLRTFRPILDAERTEPLRAEVKWLSERLGGPRDAEVIKAHLLGVVGELPAAEVVGPVRERVAHELDQRHQETLRELEVALDSTRYRRLGDQLVGLLTDPPVLESADRKAAKVLDPLLAKAVRRVTRRWDEAMVLEDELERELVVHEARKKAKAARYAWEAVAPVYEGGKQAAVAWEQVTEVLGAAQDTVVVRERLDELAALAHAAGESAFTYGILWERERETEGAAQHEAAAAIKAAVKASRRA